MSKPVSAVVTALENERRYIAKELHDSVAQTTQQLSLQAGICRKLLAHGHLEMLQQELAALEQRVQLAAGQVRELIADLRPPHLEPESSLVEYVQYAIKIHQERGGPPVEFQPPLDTLCPELSQAQKLPLMRIVQEGLLNVHKHAGAKQVYLTLALTDEQLVLTIMDNGQGFDPVEVETRPIDRGGSGLVNMRVRAEALGGTLVITSSPTGTEIRLNLPVTD
jgi:signal transduction histidine kinase